MNILLTCSGRRNYLVDYFKKALGCDGYVYTANSTVDATSMQISDGAFISPPIHSDRYIEFLLSICREYDIGLLISLYDLELPVLAKNRALFEKLGVCFAVSDTQVIEICNDKIKTNAWLRDQNLSTLFTTVNIQEAIERMQYASCSEAMFIKPRWGMGSISVERAENVEELNVLYKKVKRAVNQSNLKYLEVFDPLNSVIIQEEAKGEEFGLDVINDLKGCYKTTFTKRKIEMRNGETYIAETTEIPEIQKLGRNIGSSLNQVGVLDIDVFWDGEKATVLEINARFGGGYPFSHLAGCDIPKAYLQWAEGKEADPEDLKIEIGFKGLKAFKMLASAREKFINL